MSLITTLAIILIAASVFTVLFRALNQPLLLGYIVAGFIVGPVLKIIPESYINIVSEWAHIGIIFLLFSHGLTFSFKKLLKIGSNAMMSSTIKCIGMFAIGICIGIALRWSFIESIFLGGIFSMSSSTTILKVYYDLGLTKRPHNSLLSGSLIFEDMLSIVLIAAFSTLAVSRKFVGIALLTALAKLGFFLVLWFIVGIFLIPLFLKWTHKYLNNEIIIIIEIGLCFLMVWLATLSGFSSALGAFVMGSILAESIEGVRFEKAITGIKDLFSAIFFVSVGMMVDAHVLSHEWKLILIITIVSTIGILIFSTLGALITGQGLENSLHIGFSMAQLGEFAIIITGIGVNMEVLNEILYPVIVAVTAITTFTSAFIIKSADPVCAWLYKKLPPALIHKLDPAPDANIGNSQAAQNEWKKLLKTFFTRLFCFGVILVALLLCSDKYLPTLIQKSFPSWNNQLISWASIIVTLLVMMPFAFAFSAISTNERRYSANLIKEREQNSWYLKALYTIKILLATATLVTTFYCHLDLSSHWVILILLATAGIFYILSRFVFQNFTKLDDVFITNWNEKMLHDMNERPITTAMQEKLKGFDVHIETIEIPAEFNEIGKPLRKMPFRHVAPINILELKRGSQKIRIPRGDTLIYPHDILLVAGTSAEINKLRNIINDNCSFSEKQEVKEFSVNTAILSEKSSIVGKTLREADLRASGCQIVSILRGDKLITSPNSEDRLQEGDKVWIAGETDSCNYILSTL